MKKKKRFEYNILGFQRFAFFPRKISLLQIRYNLEELQFSNIAIKKIKDSSTKDNTVGNTVNQEGFSAAAHVRTHMLQSAFSRQASRQAAERRTRHQT